THAPSRSRRAVAPACSQAASEIVSNCRLPNGLHTDHLYVTTLPGAALLWPERRSFRAGKLMTERKRGRQREASGVRFNGRTLNDLLPQRPLLPLRSHAERALS